jgi:hypothetical protein
MSLLVDEMGHVELGEAVRFAEPWEQDASLRLRRGEVAVLADYDDHGRIRGNAPAEAIEDARRLYVARYVQGHDVELIIASNKLAHELARRVRDDLQHLGIVSDGTDVGLADGARASAGDVIIARDNDHNAGVANSDVLRIEAVHPDGSLTVRRRLDRDEATGQRRWAEDTFTYRGYATADLSYGATAHTKQGKTVTATIALVTGNESAEWLYSAMTRGARSNIACVFTQPSDDPAEQSARTRTAPELARAELVDAERAARPLPAQQAASDPAARDAQAVLADITSRRSAEMSATTMGKRNLANADHLAHLNAIWQGETTALAVDRYRQTIREALPAEWASDPLDSAQATWLWRTLRQAEAAGLDARDVARRAVEGRSLTGTRDLAAVIDARIRKDHPVMVPAQWRTWAEQVPEIPDAEQKDYLAKVASAMDARKQRLGAFAAQAQPAWAIEAAGPVPTDPAQRLEWEGRVSHVGAYRELYGWDHRSEPVGPEPSGDTPEKRAAWHAAYRAMNRLEGIDLRGRSDGRLHLMRDTYRAETEWAPAHVAAELRAVRHGRTNMTAQAARADAMAEAARKAGDNQLAVAHERIASGARSADAFYAQIEDMDAEIMTQRAEWARVTEGPRHLAVLADVELRRRYPGAHLDPLRSAEPDEPAPVVLGPDPHLIARLEGHREVTALFRARLEERQGVRIPNEDPDYEDEGEAWPSPWQPWDRDAVLKPPQPEIRPAPEVEHLAVARGDTDYEPG